MRVSWTPTSPTTNQSVQFTDTSTGSPTSWSWNFGDGVTANVQNPTHTYSNAGIFAVSLAVTNAGGSNTTTKSIMINGLSPGDTWSAKQPPSAFVNRSASVVLNGKIYVFGGDSTVYDPVTNQWSMLAPIPKPVQGAAAATVNGLIYVIGGADLGGGTYSPSPNQAYDTSTNSWTAKSSPPTGRAFAAAQAVRGQIYFVGGLKGSTFLTVNEQYDPATDTWSTKAPMPTGRGGIGSAVIDGKIYVLGGQSNTAFGVTTNEAYDPTHDSWSTETSMLTGRSEFGAAQVQGKIYVVGGAGGPIAGYLTNNEEYDPTTKTWVARAPIPVRMGGNTAAAVNGLVYSIGMNRSAEPSMANYAYLPPSVTPTVPAASFICAVSGLTVQCTDTSTGPPISWFWTFGDGASSTAQNPSHTYRSPGTYSVSLTATNAAGSNTKTQSITVNPPVPVANFSWTPTSPNANQLVQFTDTSTGSPTSWLWNFGDGQTSTVQTPTHTFTSAGTYLVSLRVTNAEGGSDTHTYQIAVNPPGQTVIYPTFGSIAGLQLNGAAIQNESVLQLTSAQQYQAGTAWLNARVNVMNGFSTTFSYNIFGGTPANGGSGSDGLTFTIQNSALDAVGSNGGGLGADGIKDALSVSFRTYVYNDVEIDSCGPGRPESVVLGGCSLARASGLNLRGQHTVQISYSSGVMTVSLDGNQLLSKAVNLSKQMNLSNGQAFVGFTAGTGAGTDFHQILSWQFTPVSGFGAPVANFIWTPTSPTANQSVQFTDTSTGSPTSWFWNFGDGITANAPNPTHGYSSLGTYSVSLTVTNAGGSNTATKLVTVSTGAVGPVANFSWTPTSPSANQPVQFNDSSTGSPTSWLWNFGDGGTSTAQNPAHTYTTAGTYTVSLTVTNAGGSNTLSITISTGSPTYKNQYLLTQVADGGGWRTTFNLANPSTASVDYQLQLKDDSGNPLSVTAGGQTGSSFTGTLPPGSSATLISSDSANLSVGIAQVSSTAPLLANGVFSSSAPGRTDFEAAVPTLSSPAQSFLLPFDNQNGKLTGVALANTGNSIANVTFTFRTEGGNTVSSGSLNLNGGTKTEFFLSDKFPQMQGQRGTAVIAAASPVLAALGLRFLPGGTFTSLPVYPTDSSSTVITRQVLSHVIDGGGWLSIVTLVNLDSTAANFQLRLFDNSGNPLSLNFNSTAVSTLSGTIPSLSSMTIVTPGVSANLVQGWADVTSSQRIRAQVMFDSIAPGPLVFEAAVPAIADGQASLAIPFDNTSGLATGIAVVNSGGTQANVQIAVRDQTGTLTDNKNVSLAAGAKTSFMLTELASNSTGKRGIVQLTTQTSSISALALRLNGPAFTTLPVASADAAAAPPPVRVLEAVTQSISASQGGTITLSIGGSVVIPPGALKNDQSVTVELLSSMPHEAPSGLLSSIGPAISITFPRGAANPRVSHGLQIMRNDLTVDSTTGIQVNIISNSLPTDPNDYLQIGEVEPPGVQVQHDTGLFTGLPGGSNGFTTASAYLTAPMINTLSQGAEDDSFSVIVGNGTWNPSLPRYPLKIGPRIWDPHTKEWMDLSTPTLSVKRGVKTCVLIHGMISSVEQAFTQDSCVAKDAAGNPIKGETANWAVDKIGKANGCEQVVGFNYDWTQGINKSGAGLAAFLDSLADNYGISDVVLEAHSEGGPVSIAGLAQTKSGIKVGNLVTLGSPLTGTPAADRLLEVAEQVATAWLAYNVIGTTCPFALPRSVSDIAIRKVVEAILPFARDLSTASGTNGNLAQARLDFNRKHPETQVTAIAGTGGSLLPGFFGVRLQSLWNGWIFGDQQQDKIVNGPSALGDNSGLNIKKALTFPLEHTGLECDDRVIQAVGQAVSAPPGVAPALVVTPTSLSFTAKQGAANPVKQSLSVASSLTSLGWAASTTTTWISVSPLNGSTPASVGVSVNIIGLLSGTYTGAINITASGATTVNVPVTLTVSPATVEQFTLIMTTVGSGTIGASSTASSLNCGANCLSFAAGSVVTVTATPSSGSTFTGWSGSCSGTGTCTLTMDTNKTVTATFNTVSTGGNLTGTWSGNYTQSAGGCSFAGTMSWSVTQSGTALSGTFSLAGHLTGGPAGICGANVSGQYSFQGSVNGNAISWTGTNSDSWAATANGNTITGTGHGGIATFSYTLTRQ